MHQRPANMKPAAMDSRDKVDLYDLIVFFKEAQQKYEMRNEQDSAFIFEMLTEYFEKDYKPSKPLTFTGRAVGL